MEKIFIFELKKQLNKRVKGKLSIHIINDTLIVDIYGIDSWGWRYTTAGLTIQLLTGTSSRNVADAIVKQYKKDILNEYFYSK